MLDQVTRDFATRIARNAFDAGLRAAGQPRGEIDRRRLDVQAATLEMLGTHIEAEVDRRLAGEGGAS